ncbi:CocE/NonD family hydrolase [Streptomyces fulvoviolaceus]|uniref:CocE/NonD family hydrolase n=1 Tax=Streptomyces fulvoviolaceus TaxID=285535 RepID=UPI001F2A5E87|nr:CocE/NonD family hydrolase [Streptomyces fulvoviolaceus]
MLLVRLPYGKYQPGTLSSVDPVSRAKRGFMVVGQDVRGRFARDGDREPYTLGESDGYDTVVRWGTPRGERIRRHVRRQLLRQYTTQWMAAPAKPPALRPSRQRWHGRNPTTAGSPVGRHRAEPRCALVTRTRSRHRYAQGHRRPGRRHTGTRRACRIIAPHQPRHRPAPDPQHPTPGALATANQAAA